MANKMNFNVKLNSSQFNKESKNIKKSVKSLGASAKEATNSYGSWFKQNKKLGNSFANINKDVNRASAGMKNFSSVLNFAKMGMAVNILTSALSNSIKASMDAIETQNLFLVSLGETADQALRVVENLNSVYGLDTTNLKSNIGTFALLSKSMGFTADQANTLSTQIAQSAIDFSSLMNVPITQVMGDLKSGLIGQTETVYKYGMDLTEASLKTEAFAEGITKSVRNMSQGEKMALRYNIIMRTISKDLGNGITIMGDFARTIDQPANQFKILQDRLTTLSRSFGNMFIPILTVLLPILNAVVIVLIDMANALATLAGYVPQTTIANALGSVAEEGDDATESIGETTEALKKLNKTILGIDELNLMAKPTESSASTLGSDSILSDIELLSIYNLMADVPQKAKEIAEKIKGFLVEVQKFFQPLIDVIEKFKGISFDNLIKAFTNLYKAVEPFGKMLFDGLVWALDNIFLPYAKFIIEETLPRWLEVLAVALGLVKTILEQSGYLFVDFYNNFLKPVGEYFSPKVIEFFDKFKTKLSNAVDVLKGSTVFEDLRDILGKIEKVLTPLIKNLGDFALLVLDFITGKGFLEFEQKLRDIEDALGLIVSLINGDFTDAFEHLKDLFVDNKIEKLKENFDLAKESMTDLITKMTEKFTKENMDKLLINVGTSIASAFNFAQRVGSAIQIWIDKDVKPLFTKEKWIEIFIGLTKSFAETMQSVYSWFTAEKWNSIGNVIKVALGTVLNKVVEQFENVANAIVYAFNKIIEGYNSVAIVDIKFIAKVDFSKFKSDLALFSGSATIGSSDTYGGGLSKYAEGGIFESPTIGEIGEAGAEAVIPLSANKLSKYFAPILGNINNEGADYDTMYQAFSDALKDNKTTDDSPIYVDGIYQGTVEDLKRKNMRAGKVLVPVGV